MVNTNKANINKNWGVGKEEKKGLFALACKYNGCLFQKMQVVMEQYSIPNAEISTAIYGTQFKAWNFSSKILWVKYLYA